MHDHLLHTKFELLISKSVAAVLPRLLASCSACHLHLAWCRQIIKPLWQPATAPVMVLVLVLVQLLLTCAAAIALSENPMRLCTGGIAMRPLVSDARSTTAVSL